MSIIIVFKNKAQLEVKGYDREAKRMLRPFRFRPIKTMINAEGGRTNYIKPGEINFTQVVSVEEEGRIKKAFADAEEAKRLAAEEKERRNPHPGKNPTLTLVGGKKVEVDPSNPSKNN